MRPQATTSDVIEECHHVHQNLDHLNDGLDIELRRIMNEIDAKEHLIDVEERYNIPEEERALTRRHLDELKKDLEGYRKAHGWRR